MLQINLYLIILMHCDDLLAIHKHTKRNCHVSPPKNQVFFEDFENRNFFGSKTSASDLDKVISGQSRRNHSFRHTWLYPEIDISSKSNEWNLFNFWFSLRILQIPGPLVRPSFSSVDRITLLAERSLLFESSRDPSLQTTFISHPTDNPKISEN